MTQVDGENVEKAANAKHLTGPSEEELSRGREATVAYVPPPMLVPVAVPKTAKTKGE